MSINTEPFRLTLASLGHREGTGRGDEVESCSNSATSSHRTCLALLQKLSVRCSFIPACSCTQGKRMLFSRKFEQSDPTLDPLNGAVAHVRKTARCTGAFAAFFRQRHVPCSMLAGGDAISLPFFFVAVAFNKVCFPTSLPVALGIRSFYIFFCCRARIIYINESFYES